MTSGLSFRLFGIPFRVHWLFFFFVGLLNLDRLNTFSEARVETTVIFLVGIATATIAVIVHELGHCAAYRRYGQSPSVMLWGLGGLTFGQARLAPRRSIIVALSGVVLSLLAVALPGYLLLRYVMPTPMWFRLSATPSNIVSDLVRYTIVWSIFNALPILPLDGGHVVEAVLEWVHGEPRKQTARLIGGVTGVGLGLVLLFFFPNTAFFAVTLAFLGIMNLIPWYQQRNNVPVRFELPDHDSQGGFSSGSDTNVVSMEKARKKRDRRSPAELVKAGYEALERREYRAALRISDRLQSRRLNAELDRWTAELAAFAWLGDRNPVKAEEVVGTLPRSTRMSTPLAAVMAVANKRTEDGMRLMVDCMVNEPEGGPKLIAVDLFAEYGMIHRLARDLVDQPGGAGFEAAVSLESMLHRLHRTQDASTVSDVILLG